MDTRRDYRGSLGLGPVSPKRVRQSGQCPLCAGVTKVTTSGSVDTCFWAGMCFWGVVGGGLLYISGKLFLTNSILLSVQIRDLKIDQDLGLFRKLVIGSHYVQHPRRGLPMDVGLDLQNLVTGKAKGA